MNHIHKSIWNEQTQTFVAVSELTRARGKKSSAGGQLIAAVALAGISGLAGAGSLDGGNNFALERAIAYGQGAIASSDGSSAVGSGAQSTQADGSAFGHQSIASGTNSTALGNQVEAAGDGSIAIQGNGEAVLAVDAASARAIAIGQNSVVTQSTSAVALGDGARASNGSNDSVAIGRLSNVTGSSAAIAIGSDANVNAGARESIAFGKAAAVRSTTGGNAIAIGSFATATATQATALGAFSQAAQAAIAAGALANASGSGSVAVGNQTTASGISAMAFGNRVEAAGIGSLAIQGNASGVLAVDAASTEAIAIGARSTIRQSVNAIVIGGDAYVEAAPNSIAIGKNARVTSTGGTDAVAVGHGAMATGFMATVAGSYSQAGVDAVAVGGVANATGAQSVAIGRNATSATLNATAVGQNAKATGTTSTLLGANTADNAVANTTLLGASTSATTGATNSVAIGDASTVARANAVSIGNATTTRQMVNLSAGTASTDAVNVSQLTGALNALGGGAGVNPVTGVVTAPSYTVGGTTVNNVGAALSNLDARTSQNTTNISNLVAGQVPDAVKYDSATHDTVTLGNAGTPVAVKNVAAGTAATDAVNKGQLDGVQSTLTTTVNNLGSQVADAVKYDSAAHNSVTLGTAGTPVAVKNIAAGTAATDAVNKSQLDGVQSTLTTTVNNLGSQVADAVKYDSAAHNSVTLGTAGTPVAVKNVAAATAATDAVNKAQLDGVQSTLTTSIGTVDTKVGALGTSTATALGGGATANPDGSITPPSYSVGGTTVRNVGAAISSLDGRTTQNTSDIGNINTALGSLSGQMADAVKYDSPAHDSVTLGATGTPVAVKNVAAGAAATDAVNKGQLDGVQSTLTTSIGAVDTKVGAVDTKVSTLGTSTAAALGGGATANPDGSITPPSYSVGGTTVRNVGAAITNLDGRTTQNTGDIANISTAVNNLGGQVADSVKYDSAAHNSVTLGAAGTPVAVKNVAVGAAATDAVNKSQLDGVQSTLTTTVNNLAGQVTDAVKYDSAAHDSVTLGNSGTAVAVKNVAAGTAASDAVNKGQLDGVQSTLTSSIGTVDTKVGTLGTSTATALGGGATANPDGSITPPSYSVGGTTVRNVGAAISSLDGRTTQNTSDIGNINTALGSLSGQMADAVKYDSPAHDSVTLGATGTPVAVKNVAAGATATDAVNKGQLDGVQSTLTSSIGTVDTKVGTLGTSTAAALGGGATANPDGSITPPSYSVGGTTVRNVGAAITNLDGRTTQNTSDIGNINTTLGTLGGQMTDTVKYDSPAHNSVTLGAVGTPVSVKNVAAGAAATDAVNKSQLDGVQSTLTTTVNNLAGQVTDAVKYDSAAHNSVTLGNAGTAVAVKNVAAGAAATDAVNKSQLDGVQSTLTTSIGTVDTKVSTLGTSTAAALGGGATANPDGSITPPSYSVGGGTVASVGAAITNLDGRTTRNTSDIGNINTTLGSLNGQMADAVKYDSAAHNSVTLGTTGTPVAVKNIAAGAAATDAVNKSQLDGVQSTLTTSIGTVDTKVGTLGTSTAAALGGGATANPDGSITPPSYSVGGGTVASVGAAITNLDGRTTRNTSDIGNINTTLDSLNGQMADAVKYDSAAHNTVTLGATGTPVAVKNIAAGAAATDAVNKAQLDTTQSTLTTSIGAVDTKVGTVDTKVSTLGTSTAAALGGGATANPDGSITPPSYSVGGGTVTSVGAAITNLDGRTTQNTGDIANINTTVNNLSTQAADAVKYDSAAHNSVTLGNAGTAVAVKNVAAGAAVTDAVNKGQLDSLQSAFTTAVGAVDTRVGNLGTSTAAALGGGATANPNGSISPPSYVVGGSSVSNVGAALSNLDTRTTQNTNNIANLVLTGQVMDAVKYDSLAHTSVTLGAVGTPVTMRNVAAGTATTDAVNKGQLDGVQSTVTTTVNNLSGQMTDAVKYDSPAHNSVTLGTAGTPVAVKNIAAGSTATDAVNKGQLDSVQSTLTTSIGTVDTKVSMLGTSTATALGGGATANPDGSITPPSYSVGGGTVTSVGAAITNIDGRTTRNTSDIGNISTTVNNLSGQLTDAVKYDSPAHNTVTLGAAGTPVIVRNIAAGTAATDAVNKSQLDGVQSSVTTTVNNLSGQMADAVKYDSAAHNSVTLGTAGTPVAVRNIAAGTAATDAANKGQLDSVQSTLTTSIGTVDTKVSTLGTSTATALGGGATANPDGSITPPSYSVGGGTVTSVGAAITNIDGRTTRNTSDISTLNTTISNLSGQAADAVKYDSPARGSVTLGNAGTPVAIRNVAAGLIGLGSTDAVNGAQLHAMSDSFATALGGGAAVRPDGTVGAPAFSVGGVTYNSVGGALSGLGSRMASIDNRVTTVEGSVTNVTNQINNGSGMIKQDVATRSINIGKDSDGGIVNVAGAGGARVVAGVQAGAVSATSTDAVNGSQLNATNVRVTSIEQSFDLKLSRATGSGYVQVDGKSDGSDKAAVTAGTGAVAIGSNANASASNSVAIGANAVASRGNTVSIGSAGNERILANVADAVENTDAINKRTMEQAIQSATNQTVQQVSHQISDIRSMVGDVGRKAFAGVAGTAALSMIPDVDSGKNLAIGVGTAQYQGYVASAVGISARINDRLKIKTGASISASGNVYGAGASYQW